MTQLHALPSAEVAAYGATLRRIRPSPQLDARIAEAIAQHRAPRRARGTLKVGAWHAGPALAAGCAAILMAALILWLGGSVRQQAPVESAALLPKADRSDAGLRATGSGADEYSKGAFAIAPTGQYSLWPTDAAVFRVRTSLDALSAVNAVAPAQGERQYWIDVRVANDGSMRIVRIVPADAAY